ncbi:MAG: dihydroxyacetone kinase subunit L [Planctomycetaceae bacterium]|jgi:dihydroxyacetone kinase-like protein|nr:dihydroxyacetone kinase subunit L [Planctomycetaceae bacterium]
MATQLNIEILRKMLTAVSETIEANVSYLNQLDSATGDGDHGTSIVKAIRAAAKSVSDAPAGQALKEILYNVGWAVMGEDCGSTSSLIGSFFMGMSEAVTSEELDATAAIALFESGLAGVRKQTKAKIGDKTLMDALIPAVDQMSGKSDLKSALESAAVAAAQGAESTRDYVAKFGRARNLGERSVGHIDAGATSIALIFDAFAKSV